ncbi:MAG: hypothetical protein HY682_08665 [Chloroflexi bacterium]|nr:hypothetical protein [Chloroflexota bacterium]
MARFLVVSTHGSENPTQATIPVVVVNGSYEAGHTAELVLMGDAVVVAKEVVRNAIVPVGWPPLRDVFATALKNGVKVHV